MRRLLVRIHKPCAKTGCCNRKWCTANPSVQESDKLSTKNLRAALLCEHDALVTEASLKCARYTCDRCSDMKLLLGCELADYLTSEEKLLSFTWVQRLYITQDAKAKAAVARVRLNTAKRRLAHFTSLGDAQRGAMELAATTAADAAAELDMARRHMRPSPESIIKCKVRGPVRHSCWHDKSGAAVGGTGSAASTTAPAEGSAPAPPSATLKCRWAAECLYPHVAMTAAHKCALSTCEYYAHAPCTRLHGVQLTHSYGCCSRECADTLSMRHADVASDAGAGELDAEHGAGAGAGAGADSSEAGVGTGERETPSVAARLATKPAVEGIPQQRKATAMEFLSESSRLIKDYAHHHAYVRHQDALFKQQRDKLRDHQALVRIDWAGELTLQMRHETTPLHKLTDVTAIPSATEAFEPRLNDRTGPEFWVPLQTFSMLIACVYIKRPDPRGGTHQPIVGIDTYCFVTRDCRHGPEAVEDAIRELEDDIQDRYKGITSINYWSDQAVDFKSCHFALMLQQLHERSGCEGCPIRRRWNYFAARHGKGACDSEGGAIKTVLQRHAQNYLVSGEGYMATAQELCSIAASSASNPNEKNWAKPAFNPTSSTVHKRIFCDMEQGDTTDFGRSTSQTFPSCWMIKFGLHSFTTAPSTKDWGSATVPPHAADVIGSEFSCPCEKCDDHKYDECTMPDSVVGKRHRRHSQQGSAKAQASRRVTFDKSKREGL